MTAGVFLPSAASPSPDPFFVLRYNLAEATAVYAGNSTLSASGLLVAALPPRRPRRVVVCSDEAVFAIHGQALVDCLNAAGLITVTCTIPAGEEAKTMEHVVASLCTFARYGIERSDVALALGGGVPGDLFGYVAASYMRGIRLVQVPTTLVAQMDSSIGGKVGVDLQEGKNLVGAFKHADCVIIDYQTLRTLPDAEWVAGSAEILKSAVIADAVLFEMLERDLAAWRKRAMDPAPVMAAALAVKARVVQEDERETGVRMILNYGHTLGHALEAVAGYRGLRHGEAVAWGMAMEARLAARLGLSDAQFVARQDRALQGLGLLQPLPILDAAAVYNRLFMDKKAQSGRLRWILPGTEPGAVTIRDDVPPDLARDLVEATVQGTLLP
jgi:3-dehydroquinate synthase